MGEQENQASLLRLVELPRNGLLPLQPVHGRVYGLATEPGAKESMGGFVSNPMDKPEASKVSLFGLADYTWNINGFKSEESWKEGVKRLFPQAAEAMQVFVNHNSDQGPNGHGYRREESVEIEPVVKRVLEAAREGKVAKADTALLKKEFARMAAARARHPGQGGQPPLDEGNRRVGGCL